LSKDLPIWLIEPEFNEKRELSAKKLLEGQRTALKTASIDDIKQQLKKSRQYASDNASLLVDQLKINLSQKYQQVKVKSAVDNADAVRYIAEISAGINTICTNNSSIVTQELKPGLESNGFTVINSCLNGFDVTERKFDDYWDLPRLFDKNLTGTFDITIKIAGLPDTESKNYLAVLGVNAISAEDTTAFFLQHFLNIHKDLMQANKVVLVIGLDKIVKTRQDAAFQTQCMGIFGMESILLDIQPKTENGQSIAELPLLPTDKERELHLIILDNGRAKQLEGKFRNLFLCIGCRACNKHCPKS